MSRAHAAGMAGALVVAMFIGPSTLAQSPGASASPAAASATWTRVEAPTLATIDTIEHAATIGTEVVAIGTRCDTEGVCGRVALATPDGLAWEERGPLPADIEVLGDLIADAGALVAVGRSADGVGAIWRSLDRGATWAVDGDQRAFRPGGGGGLRRSPAGNPYEVTVLSVARGPGGLVAGGWLNSEDDDRSAMWRETDPGIWERVPLRPAMERAGGVFDVAASEEAYVAVTAEDVWRSSDGRRWARAAVDERGPPWIRDVASTDDGFIGLKTGPTVTSTWAAASDGRRWQEEPDDPVLADLAGGTITVVDGRLVVAAARPDFESDDLMVVSVVWTREPGAAWVAETVSDDFRVGLADVVAIGDALLVVGNAPDEGGTSIGAAWLREEPTG
jgi:hypothetical protein